MKVLKFGAVWCSGCLVMRPRWQEVEKELKWLKTEYHDVDEEKDLADSYNLTDYPCAVFLDKDGKELHRAYGEMDTKKIKELVAQYRDL